MCSNNQNKALTPYPDRYSFTPRAARPTRHLSLRKSRRVAPSVPVAAGEGFERRKPEGGRPGRPAVSAETGGRIGNLRSKPDPGPKGNRQTAAERPFPFGSPQAWHRGGYPPALAPRPKAQRDAKGEPQAIADIALCRTIRAGVGRTVASRLRAYRGKSGLHRAGCQVIPGQRELTASATESRPPMAPQGDQVRVKGCGKSAPRAGTTSHGTVNPTRSKTK
ncbi:hypothetical protein ACVKN3_000812 [Luteibacter sp. PvP120]